MSQPIPTTEHRRDPHHRADGLSVSQDIGRGDTSSFDILVVGPYPPPLGGISVHISRLVRILDEAGFRVGVLNHYASTESPFVIEALRKNPYNYFRHLRKYPARVVHYHHSRWIQFFVVALARNSRSKYIITIHAGEIDKHFPQLASNNVLMRKLTVWALRRFDTVIVVNPAIVSFLEERGLHPRIELIPAFVSSDARGTTLPYDSKVVEFLESGVVITAAAHGMQFLPDGREVYGIDTLVDAFIAVSQRIPDLRLVIFVAVSPSGSRSQRHLAALEGRLEAHGVRHRVLILYGMELWPALSRSALFVRPTRADGDALSIREAQEAGVPVIASDVIPRPAGVTTFATGDVAQLVIEISRLVQSGSHAAPETSSGQCESAPQRFSDDLLRLYRSQLDSPPDRSHQPPARSRS